MNTDTVIRFEHIHFSYHHNTVLDDISFDIPSGDYVGILGPNGSGKTTLLKILLGLEQPTSGNVSLFGEHPTRAAYRRIGYIPQTVAQKDWHFPATVEEVVKSGITDTQQKKTAAESIAQAMDVLDITPLKKRLIAQLSGGQRQRVFIARALASQPDVLILDEPTVGVDIASQETFYNFIKQLNSEKKITIIFVSHDIDVIAHEAKNVLCLNKELVCHVPAKDAITSGVLEKMYGEKGKYILHGH